MSGWSAKRFWTETRVQEVDGGFTVRLDGRAVKTPAKTPLIVPTVAMAERIAAEWQAQQGTVDPRTMPWTRSANAALDKVGTRFAEVASLLAAYGDTDLLCYRADGPAELVLRQARAWDPLLAWSATALDAPLTATAGVMHVAQPPDSLARLTARIGRMTAFQLTGFQAVCRRGMASVPAGRALAGRGLGPRRRGRGAGGRTAGKLPSRRAILSVQRLNRGCPARRRGLNPVH